MRFIFSADKKLCEGKPEKFYSIVEESFARAGIPRDFYEGRPLNEPHLSKHAFGVSFLDENYEVDSARVAQNLADQVYGLKLCALYKIGNPALVIDPLAAIYLDESTSFIGIKIDQAPPQTVRGFAID